MYITHGLKCVRLQVNITGFVMPIYVTHAFKFVRQQIITTVFQMPIYITHAVIVNIISFDLLM